MNTGEIAEVVFIPPKDITKPILMTKSGKVIDLNKTNEYRIKKIV